MNQVVAFDLDGTLSQSEAFLLPAYRDAVSAMGLEPQPDAHLRQMIGGTVEDNLEIVMPGQPMERFREYLHYVHDFAHRYVVQCGKTYPCIPESLAELHRLGYRIALCSNGTPDYINFVLDTLNIQQYFDAVQTNLPGWTKSDLLGKILQDFDTSAAVMVGDRHFDFQAAKDNHVPFIGCAYGLFPQEVTQADVVITAADQLVQAVEQLLR
ncbi:MAG: HAD family hydrolase [Anaerotruncus sp.]|nr:HAD family hydrolase [Anaerotruncus sp.]